MNDNPDGRTTLTQLGRDVRDYADLTPGPQSRPPKVFFLDMLRSGLSKGRAHQQLNLAIDWGRYAELYEFDADTGQLKLDHPAAPG